MRWCVETTDLTICEVTTLFDERGNITEELDDTVACVYKAPNGKFVSIATPYRGVHAVQ